MKTLIAYCTSHGCTTKTAAELKDLLETEVQLCNLKSEKHAPLDEYDTIIIGGSIHAGQVQKRLKNFCNKNLSILKQKDIGLFICCMEEGEKAEQQLKEAFPEELHQIAKASGIFGGEFNFNRMNFIEKYIVKKVGKVEQSISKIDHKAIQKFSSKMNNALYLV
jgi:menaquinone-dependent protoporphyrinogen oxidase